MTHAAATASMAAERYLLDEMTGAESIDFESHYADCAVCFENVIAVLCFIMGLRDVIEHEGNLE